MAFEQLKFDSSSIGVRYTLHFRALPMRRICELGWVLQFIVCLFTQGLEIKSYADLALISSKVNVKSSVYCRRGTRKSGMRLLIHIYMYILHASHFLMVSFQFSWMLCVCLSLEILLVFWNGFLLQPTLVNGCSVLICVTYLYALSIYYLSINLNVLFIY